MSNEPLTMTTSEPTTRDLINATFDLAARQRQDLIDRTELEIRALGRNRRSVLAELDAIEGIKPPRKRGRPSPTLAELEHVAEVYQANINANPTDAVRRMCGYDSYSTAQRRVTACRAAGLLKPARPGRRQDA